MGYQNASNVLPPELLRQVQQYVQGELIYIPSCGKRARSRTAHRLELAERNRKIRAMRAEGISVARLAEMFYLSTQAVYSILSNNDR